MNAKIGDLNCPKTTISFLTIYSYLQDGQAAWPLLKILLNNHRWPCGVGRKWKWHVSIDRWRSHSPFPSASFVLPVGRCRTTLLNDATDPMNCAVCILLLVVRHHWLLGSCAAIYTVYRLRFLQPFCCCRSMGSLSSS